MISAASLKLIRFTLAGILVGLIIGIVAGNYIFVK